MRVGIDLSCWASRRGYGRFVRNLVRALLALEPRQELVFLLDAQSAARTDLPDGGRHLVAPTREAPAAAASAAGRRSLRDLAVMAAAAARARLDALFFPSVYTWFPAPTTATVILGIHDVTAEDYPDLVFPDARGRRLWALKGRLARWQADFILTVSAFAREGVLRRFHPSPERVWVVEEAPDAVFRPLAPEEIDRALLARWGFGEGDPFLVYLGGLNPHKNLGTLLDALAALRRRPGLEATRLAVIGDLDGDPFTPGAAEVRARTAALGLGGAVAFTGFLGDEEAVHFLSAARALVLPSFAEGFGLPAVEAAACGTPVVATRNSPLPELLEGGGLFIDPANGGELFEALACLLADEEERARKGRIALERARALTWERSARQMLELLDAVERGRARA
ncbi:MAG TPA: glycosyltransferase family 1 protein [Thermoanaerobaculia bacterium]|jgi:glycosyltransferase involved in cell wall biosynthesis|nr:glycosyltransferase family 1 protein [Thermoanaerobaculia bacterium]